MFAEASDDEVARVLPAAARRDARARHDGARAEDRATASRSSRSCGRRAARAPAGRRGRRQTCTRHAARRPRGAGGDGCASDWVRIGVRRADPRSRRGRARRRGRRLRRGHRVLVSTTSMRSRRPRRRPGSPLRVHADQLGDSGAAAAAARLGAPQRRPPEPLLARGRRGARASRDRRRASCPRRRSSCAGRRRRPAALREAGAPIAIATDCNPGTSPVLLDARGDRDGVHAVRARRPSRRSPRRPRTPPGCWASPTASARSSPGSEPTSCCWRSRRSPRCRIGRATTPSSRRSSAASSPTGAAPTRPVVD